MIQAEKVGFIAVPTRDKAQARRFYLELLGLEESTPPDGPYTEFEASNVTLAIFEPEKMGREFKSANGFALRVPDVAEARRELEAAGVEFHGETIDTGVCHMAFCTDFDGNGIVIHRRYAPPREPAS